MRNVKGFIEEAFAKLKASLYYEKNNLYLRQQMVEFCSEGIEQKLENIANRLSNGDGFEKELQDISLFILPKRIISQSKDDNILTNSFDYEKNTIDRLMIYADIPIELHIIAVLWVLLFGGELDNELNQNCWGNRLVIDEDTERIKQGRVLFKPYFKQYQQWWSKAIDEANHLLDNNENVAILNMDIQNYYHSIRFRLNEIENKEINWDGLKKKVWQLFQKIHERYNIVLKEYGFREDDYEEGLALPVGLLSSPILANYYLKEFDEQIIESLTPAYYGRYVDDILIVIKSSKQPDNIQDFIENLKIGLVHEETKKDGENKLKWHLKIHPRLTLQQEKIFLYYFNHQFSSELLSKFEKEQREHSSEYRFLSDEEDDRFDDELFDFESCFDQMEDSKARFKPQSENKYKLACYLSKFIKRRIQRGKQYGKDQERQLSKFFQGSHLIKYYFFWEKLFSLYVVSDDTDSFLKLKNHIEKQIEKIDVAVLSEWNVDSSQIKVELKEKLKEYLVIAMNMAVSLGSEEFREKTGKKTNGITLTNGYKKCHYIRKNNFAKVLQDYYDGSIYQFETSESFVPYNVHLWELMYAITYNYLQNDEVANYGIDISCIFDKAKELYEQLNGFEIDKDCEINIRFNDEEKHWHQKLWKVDVVRRSCETKFLEKIRIVPVNIRKFDNSLRDSRRGKRKTNSDEMEVLLSLLDSVGMVKKCDMFVMPELSLPLVVIPQFVEYSTRREIAFVAGLEYLNIKGCVYNVELTCLPIEINHVKDCVLIPRVKNYYSPDEEAVITRESYEIPKCSNLDGSVPSYYVYQWHGIYFTTFNCFELTNSYDRASFVGDIDLLIAITYNKDVNYFDGMAEVTSRDLHCYVVVDNIGQYGSTQVICPKKSEEKFLAKIKGATTEDNPFTLTIADLDIKGLREFQKYLTGDYKPLPAGFDRGCDRLKDV
jgi:hypothetical protein